MPRNPKLTAASNANAIHIKTKTPVHMFHYAKMSVKSLIITAVRGGGKPFFEMRGKPLYGRCRMTAYLRRARHRIRREMDSLRKKSPPA